MPADTTPTLQRSVGSLRGTLRLDGDRLVLDCRYAPHAVDVVPSADIAEALQAAIGTKVTLTGVKFVRPDQYFPDRIEATAIDEIPVSSDRVRLSDLRGTWPNATGGLTAEEFVRKLRDE